MELELQHGLLLEILLLPFCLYHERRRQDEAGTRTGAPHAKIREIVHANTLIRLESPGAPPHAKIFV